ncbi:MAG: LysM peptidoglycan-binding domain-containing protein [Bacteroidales bacterium]|nr:LysM peptidoglycan-binding domain-containing protein [Bacteroidales bacterium]
MKKYLILFVFLATFNTIYSQVKIDKSTDVIVALGRKYYVHTVKQGETLYSLSRVYGAPTGQILLINKEIVEDLKAGSILRIPVIDANYQPVPLSIVSFTEHTVQKHESLYAIAQQYNVTQDDIIKYNPQIQNGIDKGMVLKIPIEEKQSINASDEFFTYHQIRNGETLQLIATQYNVSIADIVQFNDNAKNLVTDEFIAIPKQTLSDEQKYLLMYNSLVNPDFIDIDPNYFEDPSCLPCSKFVYNDTMTFKIAILLPLYISQNYGLSYDALSEPDNSHYFSSTMIFYDYLQGTLMAINDLKKEGINLKVYIYDTKADSTSIEGIFKKYELKKMDLIFGPIYSKNYDIVKKFADSNRINIISPLSRKQTIIKNNPFVYNITPSNAEVTKFTAKYMAKYADTSMISIISDGSDEQNEIKDSLYNELKILTHNLDTVDYKEINFSKFVTPYKNNLSRYKHNYVFITSSNEVQVSAILNNLNALVTVNEYKITVYTLPVIENFTKMQADWLVNLDIHFTSTTINDLDNWNIKEFKVLYNDIFGRRPSRFSYIGYDVTYYFISALKRYGKYFQFCLGNDQDYMDSGMFMKFYFERLNKQSGFENKRLNMLYYTKDLNIEVEETPTN